MAQLWSWLLGPCAVVADGVMGVNLASIGNTLAKSQLLGAPAQRTNTRSHASLADEATVSPLV